ncbi:MAG: 23S rRNA (uracil(1939)-C(5))-methyltransferase RlmD [Gammaproteobacteria bacterium]|nr:23S rRNA (uracil(1939)-C(5))-methyltransferase RlmD [Gammaproteobacteria bacterium]
MRRKQKPLQHHEGIVESLSHDGKGICRADGKAIFVSGALPGELIRFSFRPHKKNYDEGNLVEVIKPSPDRIDAKCKHYGVCGGCSFMHLSSEKQIEAKQQVLLDGLEHIGKVKLNEILPPVTTHPWGYRRKARLGVKYVFKKEKVLVGFRERSAPYLAELEQCEVLHPDAGQRLTSFSSLIRSLSCYDKIAQIEVAIADDISSFVFRNLVDLTEEDKDKLIAYATAEGIAIYLQPKGPDSVTPLYPENPRLQYHLPDYNVTLDFEPTDFTQVNQDINPKMIALALELLELNENDHVLELFCGLGNFTLPMARFAKQITGVEGGAELIERANKNAELNNISNTDLHVANLMEDVSASSWLKNDYDKLLLDPPRSGAKEMLPYIDKMNIKRIVYVSCNPSTLARDAGTLVNEMGYTLEKAGVMDMFPHTAHVESIALFTKK